jgi:hypothetical protein
MRPLQERQTTALYATYPVASASAQGLKALPLLLHEKLISKKLMNKRREIRSKRQELRRIKNELLHTTADKQKRIEYKKRKKRLQKEVFRLEDDLRHAAEAGSNGDPNGRQAPQAASKSAMGAMPDFLIVGAKKCGTTFLYDLMSRHPYVEPAAKKELHYFDIFFEEETPEWYRRCFPPPRWKDGRRIITGEATPYWDKHCVPERIAKVLPQAQLIVLLRNPVDRAYSDYQQASRKGWETRTFEEAIEAEKTQLPASSKYLSRSTYVDNLLRWSKYFGNEQMLVLKSEDLFERTQGTMERVLDFLDLPNWEPEASEKRNRGKYEQEMRSATRQQLEEYFEPHNEKLYEYLGVEFEWQQLCTKS